MDKRFLVYEGFQDEANLIFKDLIDKFNFRTYNISDYGITFENKRIVLELSYETGIQLWLKIPKYGVAEMISKLSAFKGENVYSEYRKVRMIKNIKDELCALSIFLCTYFINELNEFS